MIRVVCSAAFGLQVWAGGLDSWVWRHPLPQGNSISAIAYGNGLFVATAGPGVLTSPDGVDWMVRTVPTTGNLNGIAFGQGLFVAVGAVVMTSADGIEWTPRVTEQSVPLNDVAYGNGRFVAVGPSGVILTSADGEEWDNWTGAVPSSFYLTGIGFGAGLFVAASNPTGIATSSDGVSWATCPGAGLYSKRVAYGNGKYFVAGTVSQVSANGVDWTSVNQGVDAVAFGAGRFVAGRSAGLILASSDGVQWTVVQPWGSSDDLAAVGFGSGVYIVGGRNGLLRTSSDASAWTTRSASLSAVEPLYGGVYAEGQFVVVGELGLGEPRACVLTSPDGFTWVRQPSGQFDGFVGVAHGNGVFVAAGSRWVGVSNDGRTWTNVHSGLSNQLASVAFGNGRFVLGAWGGQIATSVDGLTWMPSPSPTTHNLWSVTYGDGLFVAVGSVFRSSIGVVLTSPDGVAWTRRTAVNLRAVAWHDGTYVAVGESGAVRTSPDAGSWTPQDSGTTNTLYGVGWGFGVFLAVGQNGTLLSSPDAATWTRHPSGTLQTLHGVVPGPDAFVVTGDGGAILQSGFLTPRRPRLRALGYTPAAGFDLELQGEVGVTHGLQYSGDLRQWHDLDPVTPVGPSAVVRDSTAPDFEPRFYRAVRP